MEIIVSGLLAVGRGFIAVLNWINTIEGVKILSKEIKKTREK
ncbi:hypothetical protein [Kitasatospora sp. NPDC008115]